MFELEPPTGHIVDPLNGDRLVTTHAHWQSDWTGLSILSVAGVKKFEFRLKSSSIDEPEKWPKDNITRLVLMGAREFHPNGYSKEVLGMHPDIERLIEFRRKSAMPRSNFVAFEFVDERKNNA